MRLSRSLSLSLFLLSLFFFASFTNADNEPDAKKLEENRSKAAGEREFVEKMFHGRNIRLLSLSPGPRVFMVEDFISEKEVEYILNKVG